MSYRRSHHRVTHAGETNTITEDTIIWSHIHQALQVKPGLGTQTVVRMFNQKSRLDYRCAKRGVSKTETVKNVKIVEITTIFQSVGRGV